MEDLKDGMEKMVVGGGEDRRGLSGGEERRWKGRMEWVSG